MLYVVKHSPKLLIYIYILVVFILEEALSVQTADASLPFLYEGLPSIKTEKIPDFSLTVKQFSLTKEDDYPGHEEKKKRMAQIISKPKLPCLYENI